MKATRFPAGEKTGRLSHGQPPRARGTGCVSTFAALPSAFIRPRPGNDRSRHSKTALFPSGESTIRPRTNAGRMRARLHARMRPIVDALWDPVFGGQSTRFQVPRYALAIQRGIVREPTGRRTMS